MTYIIGTILVIWTTITIISWIMYKCDFENINSWEAGVKYCTVGLFKWLYEEITGKSNSDYIVNPNLVLNNQEALEIVKRMRDVFEFPKLSALVVNSYFIRIEFTAVNLISKYKDCSNAMLREIICNIIITYYLETRETLIDLFVPVATDIKVCIDIPLSEYGKNTLKKEYDKLFRQNDRPQYDILEEEIICTEKLEE